MGLSLFIILLAFFIVLNGLSQFSVVKVDQAFDSLEMTFAQVVPPSDIEMKQSSMEDQGREGAGKGNAIEDLQGVLKSILPNLNLQLNPNPDGGSVMAVRMEKAQFERLSSNLIPLFVRILNEKDSRSAYGLTITSYVRDPFDVSSVKSFEMIDQYVERMIEAGLPQYKLAMTVERGNPAYLLLTFHSLPKDSAL